MAASGLPVKRLLDVMIAFPTTTHPSAGARSPPRGSGLTCPARSGRIGARSEHDRHLRIAADFPG
jgi:hypothetical protein